MQILSRCGLGGALAITALVGCSGSSITGGGEFTTSVPAGTQLSSLTPEQKTQLCTDYMSYWQKAAPTICLAGAIAVAGGNLALQASGDSTLQMTCTAQYNRCLAGDGGAPTMGICDSTILANEPSTCSSTIGDFTTCTNMQLIAFTREQSQLPNCSSLTTENLASALAAVAKVADAGVSATCMAFEANCNSVVTLPSP